MKYGTFHRPSLEKGLIRSLAQAGVSLACILAVALSSEKSCVLSYSLFCFSGSIAFSVSQAFMAHTTLSMRFTTNSLVYFSRTMMILNHLSLYVGVFLLISHYSCTHGIVFGLLALVAFLLWFCYRNMAESLFHRLKDREIDPRAEYMIETSQEDEKN